MKAVTYSEYGPPEVLKLSQVEKPVPKAKEVLIRVHASSVTAGDIRVRAFDVPMVFWLPSRFYLGLVKPKRAVLGLEIAGDVEAVGQDVSRFKVGDAVFAETSQAGFGGYAEYKCISENDVIALKPNNLTYAEAAVIPIGGITALGMLKKAGVQAGQQALIYGASGSVGTYLVQLACHFGAVVTGVCSGANSSLVKSLGAEHVIDYTQEDFSQRGETYDLIIDAVSKFDPGRAKKALKKQGRYLNVHSYNNTPKADQLIALKELVEGGHLRPVIDKTYPLDQIVEAHRYVQQGHKKGNVAIAVTS